MSRVSPQFYIDVARQHFEYLQHADRVHTADFLNGMEKNIHDNLKKGKASLAALDSTGQSSESEMATRLRQSLNRAHLVSAFHEASDLNENGASFGPFVHASQVRSIKEHIRAINEGPVEMSEFLKAMFEKISLDQTPKRIAPESRSFAPVTQQPDVTASPQMH